MSQAIVYYDGLCRLCSAEINHYKSMRGASKISFVDITGFEFDAKKEQLDPQKIHQEMHAKDMNGNLLIGVDAFILIWSQLPALAWLGKLAKIKFFNLILQGAYSGFVKIRPYLPRKSCEESPFCGIENKNL